MPTRNFWSTVRLSTTIDYRFSRGAGIANPSLVEIFCGK
jgi:hypothetical protein